VREIGSAGGKSPKTVTTYIEATQWFAGVYLRGSTDCMTQIIRSNPPAHRRDTGHAHGSGAGALIARLSGGVQMLPPGRAGHPTASKTASGSR
jgi:hypothetical protein